MVSINIKCSFPESMHELREKFYLGLEGSQSYKNGEFSICDLQDDVIYFDDRQE